MTTPPLPGCNCAGCRLPQEQWLPGETHEQRLIRACKQSWAAAMAQRPDPS